MNEGAYMTKHEVNRLELLIQIEQRKLSQVKAAELLGLSVRQTQRLYRAYKIRGIKGLISQRRGKPSNRQLDKTLKIRIGELMTINLYRDFGPTYMTEILQREHKIIVSRETVRHLMIKSGLWKPKKQKSPVVHQQRQRRARCGELLQIDGSPHAWFEERGDKCTLLVFIDDATGRTYGKFFPSETTAAYMETTREYIKKYGRPQAMYSDRHNIFRVNAPGCIRKDNLTQFGRALKELNIRLFWANSPQAKGRVERANKTLQDRLVKELRLRGIQEIQTANRFLAEHFWDIYNQKFMISASDREDAHREKLTDQELDDILCEKYIRKISKNMEIQFENIIYQIKENRTGLIKRFITVMKSLEGKITIMDRQKKLKFQEYNKQEAGGENLDIKQIESALQEIKTEPLSIKPPNYHPWRQEGRAEAKVKSYARL